MIIKRLLLVQVILVIGLGSIALLPKVANSTPQGIALKLPDYVAGWFGEEQQVTEQELKVLAKDTEFARKLYTNGRGDKVFVSIVLSGHDLDNSIHRPERCLPAQGWSIADSRVVQVPLAGTSASSLDATRLHTLRKAETPDGKTIPIYGLDYYWFVGAKDVTPSHLMRTYIDIKDRVMYGYNQRWAYISVQTTITEGLMQFGRSEAECDAMVQDLIGRLVPEIQMSGNQDAANVAPTP
jgi:EpsI family protein